MKIFSKIRESFRKLSKTAVVTVAALGILAGVGIAAKLVTAEFYPNRTPFDYSKPCNPNDSDIYDRCGSLTGPVFNSFINTPSYGDERAFVDARRSDQNTGDDLYKNVLPNVTEGSKEVVVRMYIHNNANQSTNASGLGVAKNTKVRVFVPTATSQALRARGYISADNAAVVEDTVDFTANKEFKMSYVPGSAKLYDNDNFKNGVQLADTIVTTGAPIGSDALDGKFKGCFEYEAVVELKLKVTPKENPNVKFEKQVRKKGDKTWVESVNTKPGDEVEWLLTTQNTGDAVLNGVTVRDVLPPHVKLVNGSVKWIAPSQTVTQNDKPLFDGGINIGNYAKNGGAYIMFTTKVQDDLPADKCEVRVRNLAYMKSDKTKETEDSADVVIKKDKCVPPQPEKPKYDCKAVSLKELGGRKVRVSVTPTMTGDVTVKHYTYDFGDGSTPLVTDKDTVEYTYAKDGNYVTRVKVAFNVGDEVKEVDSDNCAAPVTFTTEVKGEQTPTVLPATGPTELVGIFVATSFAGAIAYNVVYRRFSR